MIHVLPFDPTVRFIWDDTTMRGHFDLSHMAHCGRVISVVSEEFAIETIQTPVGPHVVPHYAARKLMMAAQNRLLVNLHHHETVYHDSTIIR